MLHGRKTRTTRPTEWLAVAALVDTRPCSLTQPLASGDIRISNRHTCRLETLVTCSKQTVAPTSIRHGLGASSIPVLTRSTSCAAGTQAVRYRCSPPNPVCYSHRRTRVPPNGSRATAPARPSPEASRLLRWCLRRQPARLLRRGLPPIALGDFRARSHTN